jgi:site-specific recombinase XerD
MSIRCLCHHLISLGRLDENILDTIDPIRTERRTSGVIEDKDVDVLVSTIRNRMPVLRTNNVLRDIAIVLTMYHSGLRVSELCNLNLRDINISRRDIRVMGKGCKERVVPTTVRCMDAICDYIDLGRTSNTDAVFVKSDGSRITRRGVGDTLKALSNSSGIKHVTPHTLRRSCATSLMNRGIEVELIQSLLGHQNLSTTQQYLSISQDRLIDMHRRCHPFGEKHAV